MPGIRSTVAAAAACLMVVSLSLPVGGAAAAPGPPVITLAGSLQTELGCPADWQPGCAASELPMTGEGVYGRQIDLPAGSYEFKVTVGGSWDENYGAGGASNGPNIPLVIAGPARLDVRYSADNHLVTVAPTDLPDERGSAAERAAATPSLRAPLTKEQFYFVMTDRFANGSTANDRGGLTGDRLKTGFDPTDKGFYHGGDLKGLIGKLDYIQGLGTTSIWLTPSFLNRPVQGTGDNVSAGYHGYWITDFTRIDPHLGTNTDMKNLIAAAHKKGMKVFFDIITNHTADVIDYAEKQYTYLSKATSPYVDAKGVPFDDRDFVGSPNFPALNKDSFPYTPVFKTKADATVKVPAWLNDPLLYHNRGDSTYAGESATYGDFSGLDDLFTERREVVTGMENIYKTWVDFGIDGFRIDTVKHVNTEFWQQFSPALLARATQIGNPDFFMFGEVYDADPKAQSLYTTTGKLPATLDFGFQSAAVATANGDKTSVLADLFAGDDYYTDTDSNAYNLPTFLGNHDMGRIGNFVGGSLAKDLYAHALMYTLRGQPVVYYGDEQGFIGDGGDKDARQDMFPSKVASYNDDAVIGGTPGSTARFGTSGTMYRAIAALGKLRSANPALQDGTQITRYASNSAGIFAVSRIDRRQQLEYLVVANNSATTKTASFDTYSPLASFTPIYGAGGSAKATVAGTVTVSVPPLSVRVLKANRAIAKPVVAQPVFVTNPGTGGVLAGRTEVKAAYTGDNYAEATFLVRPVGGSAWKKLGTDDNAPYRVFHDVTDQPAGSLYEYRVVMKDNAGNYSAASAFGVVGDPPPATGGGGVGEVEQPSAVSVPGSLGTEMGCAADWAPDCTQAQLTLDPNDQIWKGTYTLPAGPYAYKAAINKNWDENYGAGAVRNGGNLSLDSDGSTPISFYYDHRTHNVSSTAQGPIVVAAGSFQSEMGCASDHQPDCLRSWLQDPDGDGVYSLATTQIPAGTYATKAAVGLTWDENYGAGGVPNGADITFEVGGPGLVTTFQYNSVNHVLTVAAAPASVEPDLGTATAIWLSKDTVAYPVDRLPVGTDPRWLRFRLHWGSGLVVDATGVGGTSARLGLGAGAPEGYIALKLDLGTAGRVKQIKAAPGRAVAVYTDAGRLIDATGLG
ncbi:hypothetical protein D1871_02700 [Nakamurella silvestris]|nr:hypothetical protein D1871_02700 [Nakamurella silvestris]